MKREDTKWQAGRDVWWQVCEFLPSTATLLILLIYIRKFQDRDVYSYNINVNFPSSP